MEYGINDWRNAIFESDLSPKARLVGLALAKYYRQGKECFPSYRTLWEDTGYTNNHTIAEAINELKESGFIRIKRGKIKNLSIQSQAYEFVGVTGEPTGEVTGEVTGEPTGEVTGENNSPEIREEENKRISNNKKTYKKVFSKEFEEWWKETPRKVSKDDAFRKFNTILAGKIATYDELMNGMKRYAEHCRHEKTEDRFIKHPSTWLNQGCWKDEYKTEKPLGWLEDEPKKEHDWSWV